MMTLLTPLILASVSLFAAETALAPPVVSDADQILLVSAQLSAERAEHAVDKATAEYYQALTARDKALTAAQKSFAGVIARYDGCSPEEAAKQICQVKESEPDKDGRRHFSIVRKPEPKKP